MSQTDRQTERQAQYVVTCVNVLSQETPATFDVTRFLRYSFHLSRAGTAWFTARKGALAPGAANLVVSEIYTGSMLHQRHNCGGETTSWRQLYLEWRKIHHQPQQCPLECDTFLIILFHKTNSTIIRNPENCPKIDKNILFRRIPISQIKIGKSVDDGRSNGWEQTYGEETFKKKNGGKELIACYRYGKTAELISTVDVVWIQHARISPDSSID